MSPPELRLERLRADHDIAGFTCGVDPLDRWLGRHAVAAQQMDSARTFVVVRDHRVVGYVSLTMGSVQRANAPQQLVRGMPGYPVAMVWIAPLAVDTREQSAGLARACSLMLSAWPPWPRNPSRPGWSSSTRSTSRPPGPTAGTGTPTPLIGPSGPTGE